MHYIKILTLTTFSFHIALLNFSKTIFKQPLYFQKYSLFFSKKAQIKRKMLGFLKLFLSWGTILASSDLITTDKLLFASTGQAEALSPFNVQSSGWSFSPTQLNLTSNYLEALQSHHSKGSNTCRFIPIIKSGYKEPLQWCSPCDEQKGVHYSRLVSLYMCG